MTIQVGSKNQDADHERTLIATMRALPETRVAQLIDFARFLKAQTLAETLAQEEDVSEVEADNARWDTLFEDADAQDLLDQLADEALAEYRAGRANLMAFTKEGRMIAE